MREFYHGFPRFAASVTASDATLGTRCLAKTSGAGFCPRLTTPSFARRTLVADTFYWIALLYRRDPWHARVAAFSQTITATDRVWTTDAVLMEVLAALSAAGARLRHEAVVLVDELLTDPQVHVVEATHGLFLEGLSLYRALPDKEYSL